MTPHFYADENRVWEALGRYEYRPVTLPAGATFTNDARRAVSLAAPFSARIRRVK